jgi:excisionase family DNA binding protein
MRDELFTVDQVAGMLGLHPKTVRKFIREGRLAARKAGKKWRILKKDLDAFMGADMGKAANAAMPAQANRDKIQVTSIVDVFVNNEGEGRRISNSIFAVLNSKDQAYGNARCDYIFYESEKKARFVLWGGARFMADLLQLLSKVSD